ncbi:Pectate lyase superfamily protein [Thalassoglobus neptunius]|uniref:Pectate lyase superfamily protein n=1 Tax=Thalassoglobus neptunius TaxID=1938619 RepID=A0A5C5X2S1_9PLAN|nr:right-handed parallel beta-helix repeat-containing protein [Thalassoglobus neptunius]TWT57414.1 Pectate lyase superfamily protein [Thalassoglobus neptunius]
MKRTRRDEQKISLFQLLSAVTLWGVLATTTSVLGADSDKLELPGDGVTDVTEKIQEAINSGNGHCQIPPGVHRITQTLTILLDEVGPTTISGNGVATILMDGEGPAIRFVGTHDGTAAPNTVKRNVWENQRAPMVDGLEIVGKNPKGNGIEATGTMQLTVTRCVLRELHHGIHLTKRNRNIIISDCHIYDNSGIGVFYDDVNLHQSNIVGCHISYNDLGGIVSRAGDVRNVHIGTCDIEGNMGGPGKSASANIDLDSRNGSIAEVAIVGCTIQHDHVSENSANIRFNGNSTARPITDETRHGNLTIADNVLSDVVFNIEVTDARGVSITGNTVWKGYEANLVVKNSANIVVANNVFDRNPRYHYGDGSASKNGLHFTDCSGVVFNGNLIDSVTQNDAAIQLLRCKHFNFTSSLILNCKPVAIDIRECERTRIFGCLIERPEDATDDWKAIQIVESQGILTDHNE